jgi:hypothetical protein
MRLGGLAAVFVVCALAGTASVRAADEEKKSEGMSRSPAPASGSMPREPERGGKLGTEPTARAKLGTEPTARGKLGTDPKPDESGKPPRLQ